MEYGTVKLIRTTVAVFLVSVQAACEGGGSGAGNTPPLPPIEAIEDNQGALVGRWQSIRCVDAENGRSDDSTNIFREDFTGEQRNSNYFGANCLFPAFDVITPYTYREGNSVASATGGIQTELDIFFGTLSLIPFSEISAALLNEEAFCGITNWEVNVQRNIAGCSIGRIEFVPDLPQFTIYQVAYDELLYFGNEVIFDPGSRTTQLTNRPAGRRVREADNNEMVFPSNVSGFWELEGNDSFYRFADDGTLTIYQENAESGCYEVGNFRLTNVGGDQYIDETGRGVGIRPLGLEIELTIEPSPQVFTLVPADRNALVELDFCRI